MARLELQQLTGNTYYIPAPTNIGVYVEQQQAILIDSGNDAEAGRQILKLLTEQRWTLRLIINTHSNADHIGGNAFLQAKTQCRIAATHGEAPFINAPLMEPAFLYGGFPLRDLRNKFMLAEPSRITDLIPSTGPILDTTLEAIPLPGHFVEMIGIRTPDNIVFLADSLFPENILRKYHVVFWYDLNAQFQTMEQLATLAATQFVPSHGQLTSNLYHLITANRQSINDLLIVLLGCCQQEPISFEDLLAHVCQVYSITLNANQYVLVGSTLKSCLAYLEKQDRLQIDFSKGRMKWLARPGITKP